MNQTAVEVLLQRIVKEESLNRWDPHVEGLLGVCVQERLSDLITTMVTLSKHRTAPPPEGAVMADNVRETLAALAARERATEERYQALHQQRREAAEARELARSEAESAAAIGSVDEAGRKRDRRGPMGATSSARNLSEDAQKKLTNQTARLAVGGARSYSWLTNDSATKPAVGGGFGIQKAKRGGPGSAPGTPGSTTSGNQSGTGDASKDGSKQHALPYLQEPANLITMRDALTALEMDAQDAGNVYGRGAMALYRGYAKLRD